MQKIVEPFAGGAGYSLRHHHLDVYLYDVNPVVAGVWDFITSGDSRTIDILPDVIFHVDEISQFPQEVKWLVGFWMNAATVSPCKTLSSSAAKRIRSGVTTGFCWRKSIKERIVRQMPLVRHWRVQNKSWEHADHGAATYFVDPPFSTKGVFYPFNSVDYGSLSEWCTTRQGQVIVCESSDATWLPFTPLATVKAKGVRNNVHNDGLWVSAHNAM